VPCSGAGFHGRFAVLATSLAALVRFAYQKAKIIWDLESQLSCGRSDIQWSFCISTSNSKGCFGKLVDASILLIVAYSTYFPQRSSTPHQLVLGPQCYINILRGVARTFCFNDRFCPISPNLECNYYLLKVRNILSVSFQYPLLPHPIPSDLPFKYYLFKIPNILST
jgi:hypothetical protein